MIEIETNIAVPLTGKALAADLAKRLQPGQSVCVKNSQAGLITNAIRALGKSCVTRKDSTGMRRIWVTK